MDTTLLALVSALGGATIAGIAGLVTHIMTGRREHRKWILDKKFEVYSTTLTAISRTSQKSTFLNADDVDRDQWIQDLSSWSTTDIQIMQSAKVQAALGEAISAATLISRKDDATTRRKHYDAFTDKLLDVYAAIRADLGIEKESLRIRTWDWIKGLRYAIW